jgi:hypothetical protein
MGADRRLLDLDVHRGTSHDREVDGVGAERIDHGFPVADEQADLHLRTGALEGAERLRGEVLSGC